MLGVTLPAELMAAGGVDRLPGLFEFTDFHQTNTHLYIFGYTSVGERGTFLRVSRAQTSTSLEIECDEREHTVESYEKELRKIHESSHSNGGLQPVCKAYGILGCFRFLAGYYFLVLTERQFVGSICGHGLFEVKNVELIPLANGNMKGSGREHAAERRYRKLITSGLDLSKDFLVSYSYSLCHTLQANLTKPPSDMFGSRFVWNEYLTRAFRHKVAKQWVLPLIHGALEQKVLSVFGATVQVTLISRRSRFFAGTRYRKRGINGNGHVANDVETEQIVQMSGRDSGTGRPLLSAVVQMRGSIPLYWSQDPSPLNVKPMIQLQNFDPLCESTALHFDDLSSRYGNPAVVLNLVKSHERTPHESVLGDEFKRTVKLLNDKLRPPERAIVYHSFDFTYVFKRKGFECVVPELRPILDDCYQQTGLFVFNPYGRTAAKGGSSGACSTGKSGGVASTDGGVHVRLQRGLLRTNCIDCLDRTNAVQCIYGLLVLGAQLQELDLADTDEVDLDSSMAMEIMAMYERMGDCLSVQYGGSEAHSQFFHRQRGEWNASVQSRDLMTSIRRFYSNTVSDAEKQHAMNLFLGNFVPQPGKPAVWELESDSFLHAGAGPGRSMQSLDQRDASQAGLGSPGSGPSSPTSHLSSPPQGPLSALSPPEGRLRRGGGGRGRSGGAAAAAADDDGGDLASDGSGSLDDEHPDGVSERDVVGAGVGVGGLRRGDSLLKREACMSESTALAVAVTGSVDGLLGRRSDLDCAAKELDAGLEAEPLRDVMNPHGNWSLFRGGSTNKAPEVRPAKIHSFDALMSAPQGCPVSVRMQRDGAARQQTQPLFNFFKNALGLNTQTNKEGGGGAGAGGNPSTHNSARSPRASHLDQSTGLDGRSDMSRDLSTTHALSRTLSFMSCGVSENLLSPTGGPSSHTHSFFHPGGSPLDEHLRGGGLGGIPRTRIAGLPLFLHGDVLAMGPPMGGPYHGGFGTPTGGGHPQHSGAEHLGGSRRKHLPRTPMDMGLSTTLGSDQMAGLSGQIPPRGSRGRSGRSRQLMHSMTENLPHESPSMDMSNQLNPHDSNASAPLLSGVAGTPRGWGGTSALLPGAATGPLAGGGQGGAAAGGWRAQSALASSRSDMHRHDTAAALLLAGTGGHGGQSMPPSAHPSLARRSATILRTTTPMHSGRPSSPGAVSTSSAPLNDHMFTNGAAASAMLRDPSRLDEGPVDTAISAALSDLTDAAPPDSYRQLTPATSALLPVVDEVFLSTKPTRRSVHGSARRTVGEHNVAQAMQDTLKTWVQQDTQLSTRQVLEGGSGGVDVGVGVGMHAAGASNELRMSMQTNGMGDSVTDSGVRPELGGVYNNVGDLSFLSDLPEVQAEFGRWLDQYSAAFMDPMEEARLVEQYSAALNGMHTSLCVPAMP